jgi:hypothetical protein
VQNWISLVSALAPWVAIPIAIWLLRPALLALVPKLKSAEVNSTVVKAKLDFTHLATEIQQVQEATTRIAPEVAKMAESAPKSTESLVPASEITTSMQSGERAGVVLDWQDRQRLIRAVLDQAVTSPNMALVRLTYEVGGALPALLEALGYSTPHETPGIAAAATRLRRQPNPMFSRVGNACERYIQQAELFLTFPVLAGSPEYEQLRTEIIRVGIELLDLIRLLASVASHHPEFLQPDSAHG